ncbi:MAG: hypothetical protein JKY51_08365 [Opitutaceae bacterium]|nr:hypothetical protein [Opitutaceae bacterium]
MDEKEFSEIVDLIRKEDDRFEKRAYYFLRDALDFTLKEQQKKRQRNQETGNHVNGEDLLKGIRVYALDQFGPMVLTVFKEWRIRCCADFGGMVFNLIEYGVWSKTEDDKQEDFFEVYDFDEAFARPFQPSGRSLTEVPVLSSKC